MHDIAVLTENGVTVVSPKGELDAFTAPGLSEAFSRAQGDGQDVVVDLGDVAFMDSTALGLVVRAVRELGDDGRAVRVVLPKGTARRVFEITTVDRVLPVAGSRTDALAELVAES